MRAIAAYVFVLTAGLMMSAQDARLSVDRVVVYKHARKLVLSYRGQELRSYKIALGSEPIGPKTRQGDHRTPEGIYVLDSRNPNSHYYKAFHVSYPNANDKAEWSNTGKLTFTETEGTATNTYVYLKK